MDGTRDVVKVEAWRKYVWLRHGFSTRAGGFSNVYAKEASEGELNLGFTTEDEPTTVARNRTALIQAIAPGEDFELATVRQVHGVDIQIVHAAGVADVVEVADGMMTQAPEVMLGIQVADCVPVLLADTQQRVVAALHAGWRGTVSGIVDAGVRRMRAEFGSRPEDMIAAVGPSIGACCYLVGDEVYERFSSAYPDANGLFARQQDGLHLDLAQANRRQLRSAGVPNDQIAVLGECTACTRIGGRRRYFSHRAESGFTGRAMGMIGISAKDRAAASAP